MAAITRPMIVEIAADTYFINEFGFDSLYVLIGKERAMLIDTGSSFIDLKALMSQLTDKPYDVVITHCHPDHGGGMFQFDKVYMHPDDDRPENYTRLDREHEVEYLHIMQGMKGGYQGIWGVTPEDYVEGSGKPEILPLYDGQVFDLGDRKVEVIVTPGHSKGSCEFLDHGSKILFSGDAHNGNVGLREVAVSSYIRSVQRVRARYGEYTQIFSGHTSYASTIDIHSQKVQTLDDIIEAYRSILRGDAKVEVRQNHLFPEMKNTFAIYGSATVGWNPELLWEDGEEHIIP